MLKRKIVDLNLIAKLSNVCAGRRRGPGPVAFASSYR